MRMSHELGDGKIPDMDEITVITRAMSTRKQHCVLLRSRVQMQGNTFIDNATSRNPLRECERERKRECVSFIYLLWAIWLYMQLLRALSIDGNWRKIKTVN